MGEPKPTKDRRKLLFMYVNHHACFIHWNIFIP